MKAYLENEEHRLLLDLSLEEALTGIIFLLTIKKILSLFPAHAVISAGTLSKAIIEAEEAAKERLKELS